MRANRHFLIIVFDDDIGLLAVFQKNVQVFAHPIRAQGVRCKWVIHLGQLVTHPRLCFDGHRLGLTRRTPINVNGLNDLVFAFANKKSEFLSHESVQ